MYLGALCLAVRKLEAWIELYRYRWTYRSWRDIFLGVEDSNGKEDKRASQRHCQRRQEWSSLGRCYEMLHDVRRPADPSPVRRDLARIIYALPHLSGRLTE